MTLAARGDTGSTPPPRDTAPEWLNDAPPPNPDGNMAAWPFLRALIPHADAVAARYNAGKEPPTLGRVLNQIAMFYHTQGAYQDALRLGTASVDSSRRIYGDNHRETAISLGNLAWLWPHELLLPKLTVRVRRVWARVRHLDGPVLDLGIHRVTGGVPGLRARQGGV